MMCVLGRESKIVIWGGTYSSSKIKQGWLVWIMFYLNMSNFEESKDINRDFSSNFGWNFSSMF